MTDNSVVLRSPGLPAENRSALVIATATYSDPLLRQLRAPATDAEELASVLADPNIGAFDVTSVLDKPSHDVHVAIESFLNSRRPDDMVLVYLSCHGITDNHRNLHFAAADTQKSLLGSTAVASTWVIGQLEYCRARRQILILDCCFSGAFARGSKGAHGPRGSEHDDNMDLRQVTEAGRGRVVLTASTATEYSFESLNSQEAFDDAPAPPSVFTAALVAGLRDGSADSDGDGFITVDEAYDYAFRQVRASGAGQTPQRWLTGGEGDLLLARNPRGRRVRLTAKDTAQARLVANSLARQALEDVSRDPDLAIRLARAAVVRYHPTTFATRALASALTARQRAVVDGGALQAGEQTLCLAGPSLTALAWAPDGERLAAVRSDGVVPVWHRNGAPANTRIRSRKGTIVGLTWASDLHAFCADNFGTLWELAVGQRARRNSRHSGAVWVATYHTPSDLLATAGDDHTVRIRHLLSQAQHRQFAAHKSWIRALAWSMDGRLLASADVEGEVKIWDVATTAEVQSWKLLDSWALSLAWASDSSHLAAGGLSGAVYVWNVPTGTQTRVLLGHNGEVRTVDWSSDGQLASGGIDGTLHFWAPATGPHPTASRFHSGALNAIAWAPRRNEVAVCSSDGSLRVVSLEIDVEQLVAEAEQLRLPDLSAEEERKALGLHD